MRTALRSLLVPAVVCGLALPLAAAPKEDTAKKKSAKAAAEPAAMYKLPETITLNDEQKTKLGEIKKEYTPKFQALAKKNNEILTREQRTARRDAMKAAKEAGKKGKELQASVEEAMKLSEDQKKKLAEVKAEQAKLRGEMETKVVALLTPEQKEQLPKPKKGKRAAKNKKAA